MPKFIHKPLDIEAEQFIYGDRHPQGVFFERRPLSSFGEVPFILNKDGEKVYVENFDMVIKEPDGKYHRLMKPSEFKEIYQPKPEYKFKIFSGNKEIYLKTDIEVLLASALKAVVTLKGEPPELNDATKNFYLDRFSFRDAMTHWSGTLQVGEDGNNGRDFARIKK